MNIITFVRVGLTRIGVAGLCLIALQLVIPEIAQAVPVFARTYRVPCTTCHVQFPKLNEFGMRFKQNGYRMEGERGKAVWLKNNVPLAAEATISYENVDAAAGQTRTIDRRALDFFSAGSLAPEVSYFLDYGFSTDQYTTAGGDSVTVTTMVPGGTFLIFNDIMPDNLMNVRVGVMSDEMFYLASARRTTETDYLAPVSPDNIGVEVNGVLKDVGLRYAFGLGNDEMVGIGGVTNNLRSGYGWATYTVAHQTIGARFIAAQSGTSDTADGTHTESELTLDLHHGLNSLTLGYYAQSNLGGVRGDKQSNLLAELVIPATQKLLLTGRYEVQDTEVDGVKTPGRNQQTVANISYFTIPNVSLQAEYRRSLDKEGGTQENVYIVGIRVGA